MASPANDRPAVSTVLALTRSRLVNKELLRLVAKTYVIYQLSGTTERDARPPQDDRMHWRHDLRSCEDGRVAGQRPKLSVRLRVHRVDRHPPHAPRE